MKFTLFRFADESNGYTIRIRPGCTADAVACGSRFPGITGESDAVDLIFRIVGNVVVDDQTDVVDIDAPGNNIGCD